MTTVPESRSPRGKQEVGEGGTGSHTQLILTQGCCPLLSLLLQHSTEPPGGRGSPWLSCVPARSLSFLRPASSSVGSSLLPAPVGTSVAQGSPQNPPHLATTSQFPGKPLKQGPARKQTSLFLLEPNSRN